MDRGAWTVHGVTELDTTEQLHFTSPGRHQGREQNILNKILVCIWIAVQLLSSISKFINIDLIKLSVIKQARLYTCAIVCFIYVYQLRKFDRLLNSGKGYNNLTPWQKLKFYTSFLSFERKRHHFSSVSVISFFPQIFFSLLKKQNKMKIFSKLLSRKLSSIFYLYVKTRQQNRKAVSGSIRLSSRVCL